jgi:prophage regulatory protein
MLSVTQPKPMGPQAARRFVPFQRFKPDYGITYSRMHIGRLEKADRFPKRVQLGPNSVAWVEDEIIAWQAERIAARDRPEPADDAPRGLRAIAPAAQHGGPTSIAEGHRAPAKPETASNSRAAQYDLQRRQRLHRQGDTENS